MDNKDFVSYETAKRLKGAGFSYPCSYYYTSEDAQKRHVWLTRGSQLANLNKDAGLIKCSAPTLWNAQKWLREEHKLHILVDSGFDTWWYKIFRVYGFCMNEGNDGYKSYEEALSAGIDSALDLINNKTE